MAQYKIGTADPTITSDVGAGVWNSESKTVEIRLKKAAILSNIGAALAVIGDDAAKHDEAITRK